MRHYDTHSPTTAALVDESALFAMTPLAPGINKVSKDRAIKDLTDGVPTLSLTFDGRRQIFVESPRDVEVYQAAYNETKKLIDSEISLNFIATGVETPAGTHVNTGCSVVEKITANLRSCGAIHTYGLLDWDGRNTGSNGIFILAENQRDGLESVIFDPLLLLNAVTRNSGITRIKINWPTPFSYIDLGGASKSLLQEAIDWVQAELLGFSPNNDKIVEYVGGFNLKVDDRYLKMDDHELENAVLNKFPELQSIQKRRTGELMKWIARTILQERLNHTPVVLVDLFRSISLRA